MTYRRNITVLLILLTITLPGYSVDTYAQVPSTDAEAFITQVRKDTEWFGGYPSRAVGQPGHDEAFNALYQKVKAIAGSHVWRHAVPFVVPQVLEATLTLEAGPFTGRHRIYPFWPAGPRLNTTPAEGIQGNLIYVGKATLDDFPAESLRGQIAAIEMTNGENWRNALAFGARAILFLGSQSETHWDMRSHEMVIPLNVPRFYLPDGELAHFLRSKKVTAGHILSKGRWREVAGHNIYALVPSRNGDIPRKAAVIVVQADSMCMVPELAAGADAAVDTALALNLMKRFVDHPPDRPVLFAFIDGFALNMKGIRYMLGALAAPGKQRAEQAEKFESLLETYRAHAGMAAELQDDPQAVYRVHQYPDLYQYVKDEASGKVLAIEDPLAVLRAQLYAADKPGAEGRRQIEQNISELRSRRTDYGVARKQLLEGAGDLLKGKLFSWTKLWQPKKGGAADDGLVSIDDRVVELAEQLWLGAQERIYGQVEDVEQIAKEYGRRNQLRSEISDALNLGPEAEIPISFIVGIDLSDAGIVVGPNTSGRMINEKLGKQAEDFFKWLKKADWDQIGAALPSGTLHALASEPWQTTEESSFVVGETAMMTSQVAGYGLPHMSWATLDAYRAKVDTPQDRPGNIAWNRLAPQIHLTAGVIPRLCADITFKPELDMIPRSGSTVEGRIVAQSPRDPTVRFPQEGYLASLFMGQANGDGTYDSQWVLYGRAGVRRQEFAFTGWDGRFYAHDWPNVTHLSGSFDLAGETKTVYFGTVSLQGHKLSEDGSIVGALNMKITVGDINLSRWIVWESGAPLVGEVFACKEMSAFHLYDPRFLLEIGGTTVVDAIRDDVPKRMNIGMHDGIMSGLMPHDVRWQVVQRIGMTTNRLLLLNLRQDGDDSSLSIRDASGGFAMDQALLRHPAHQATRDMYLVNDRRLADYRRAGIISEPIDREHNRTKSLLARADEASRMDDGGALFYAAAGAQANEVRSYRSIRELGDDVVRAVIMLLLLLMPFSFATERLLFASTHPYRQIPLTLMVFTLMTALLWSFHPAFRITRMPVVIIMAFGIISLALVVMSVVYFKFKASAEQMILEHAESSGASTSKAGLMATAIYLGLANMRKRRLRTGLTGATVVLITFALLCFTSTTTYIGEKEEAYQTDSAIPYTGVLVRRPSQWQIPRRAELYVDNIVRHMGIDADPETDIAARYWWSVNLRDHRWQPFAIHVRSSEAGRQASVAAGLGLEGNENRFTRIDRILPNWSRFAELERAFPTTQRGGCYLADYVAEKLDAKPGDTMVIGGWSMELVGTYDAKQLEQVTDLDSRSLLPAEVIDPHIVGVTDPENALQDIYSQFVESGGDLAGGYQVRRIAAGEIVILPASLLRRFGKTSNATLRTIAVRTESIESARAVAAQIGQRTVFPTYFGSAEDGVRLLAFVPLLPQVARSLWILMILAGLIIFNTMMSSIAERKGEIYIHTSMGLAPLHIGVLFMAEGFAYGLMGAIFGYIGGQAMAAALGHLGWLGGLSLNYSGTHAVFTMLMVLCITIVSSVIPAYLAGRMAVPSSKMQWAVPEPVDGLIYSKLPFTVTDKTANGTILFLHDYFDAHREAILGGFIVHQLALIPTKANNTSESANSLSVMMLQARVSLAPYDMGVRQDVEIAVLHTETPEVLEIEIRLKHVGGQEKHWVRLNRTFLKSLRRQLLGWRNLRPRRILRYVADGEERLAAVAAEA